MPDTMTKALQTPNERKIEYVETQIEEMSAIKLRNEVDIYINENAKWDKEQKGAVGSKIFELEKQNDTLSKAIDALKKLKSKLEK